MAKQVKVAPSLLAADPLNFEREIRDIEKAGADWHHVDVMDGHFVPNLTYGLPFVAALKKKAKLPLDVHIMVSNPDEVAELYVNAGADYLVFHVETARHAHRLIQKIHDLGAKAGVAINPGTNLDVLEPLVQDLDLINVMSVNPGFSGQKFISATVERIDRVAQLLAAKGCDERVLIEVDGGMNENTAPQVLQVGASVIVAGNHVYRSQDRSKAIAELRHN